MTQYALEVPAELEGERADKVLAVLLDVSRSEARRIVDAGDAALAGVPVAASHRLAAGDTLDVDWEERSSALEPDDGVPFDVIHADDEIIVIDKPADVVVHPASDRSIGTLVHGLLAAFPEIEGVGEPGRWGIVHRLDRDTSGLLVVARTPDAHEALSSMLRRRDVTRRYLSLVSGAFESATGTIDAPIGRDPGNPTRMQVRRDGRQATTHYRRLATWDRFDVTLASVTLDTGRTHQIRVHMRAIDHPIIGDRAYGRSGTVGDPGRPWLHARELAFAHPTTKEDLEFISPLPRDLGDSLVALGDPDRGRVADADGSQL